MPLPPALVRAYHRWRQLDVSFRHLEMGRRGAPTYGIENDLDHLHSSLCTEMDELMTHARWPHRSAAGEALAVLSHIEAELESLEVNDEDSEPLRTYIATTRELAEELERLPSRWRSP
jgi:hypothetical protein